MKKLKRHLNLKKVSIIGGSILLLLVLKNVSFSGEIQEKIPEKRVKQAETILYGEFNDNSTREVLATVESPAENTLTAKTNGTISRIFVNIGSTVKKGAILATYDLSNDSSQIQYENALNTVLTTQITTQNSIQNAELSLQNAKSALAQVGATQKQTSQESLKTLQVQLRSSLGNFESAKDYADSILGASQKYQREMNSDAIEVGQNNSIKKQNTKVQMQELNFDYERFENDTTVYLSIEKELAEKSDTLIDFLERLQNIIRDINTLIRETATSGSFSQTTKSSLEAQATTFLGQTNADLGTVNSLFESIKSGGEYEKAELLAAQNAVKNAEANLEISKSNAQAQISSAENARRLSQKTKNDLSIKSPISGIISEIFINENDDVSVGKTIATVVSQETNPEIKTFLSPNEFENIQTKSETKVVLSNGEEIFIKTASSSAKLDPNTQKMEVRFFPTKEEISGKNIPIGSFAKIHVPLPEKTTLIPLSAISFEPDGAEVLIINAENKVERKKIIPGKIIGNTIDVSGIEENTLIVRYRSRFHAGEEVQITNKKP